MAVSLTLLEDDSLFVPQIKHKIQTITHHLTLITQIFRDFLCNYFTTMVFILFQNPCASQFYTEKKIK